MMYVEVAFGFVFLLAGAEFLVRGAVALAAKLGISPLVIGMTVVALGTSAPELVVSLDAALAGAPGMALGNVIGSNITNVLLIMGAAGLMLSMKTEGLILNGVALLGGTVLFAVLCWQGEVTAAGGALLLAVIIFFLGHSYLREKRSGGPSAELYIKEAEEFQDIPATNWVTWSSLIAGIAGVGFGAELLVSGGVDIARMWGVSDEVIGLTLIALGTSLPELAASVVAARRGHGDVALGNVVGSNLFNVLAVIGVVAVVTPLPVPEQIMAFDLWVLIGVTVLILPFIAFGRSFNRVHALVFLALYAAYMGVQAYGVGNFLNRLAST